MPCGTCKNFKYEDVVPEGSGFCTLPIPIWVKPRTSGSYVTKSEGKDCPCYEELDAEYNERRGAS